MTGPDDTAAELRLIRAEMTAIRRQVIREQVAREQQTAAQPYLRPARLPGPPVLPERHYRVARALRHRLHKRAHAGPQTHAKISSQRRLALWLTGFAGMRTFVWVVAMALIIAHWCGLDGGFLHWFTSLSATVIFVTFISFYCNASTDAANMVAGFAALFSADSHAAAVATRVTVTAEFAALEGDIARLADLQPGDEATALSASIRARLETPS